jgi:glutamate/aspartate transport system permease protein
MVFTLQITALGLIGGVALGTVIAMMRFSKVRTIAIAAGWYVNVMRSVPLVLTIFWFYFLVPSFLASLSGADEPIQINAFATSVVAFIVFEAAYYGEIIRAGVQSVSRNQVNASLALGMSDIQTMRWVILPQAFRVMVPVLLTQTVILFQDVSLVYVLSITDFVGAASKIAERDNRLPEMYLFVAVVYFAISYGLSVIVRYLRRREVAAS